jgi:GT2 family glycosyltransferase
LHRNIEGVFWKWIDQTRNVSSVTGACLGIRAELFRRLGGFDTEFPSNYGDVDICLRVGEAGYRVVYEPSALLRHYEGKTRELSVDYSERERFYRRWHRIIEAGDPFYNPNLAPEGEEAFLNFKIVEADLGVR